MGLARGEIVQFFFDTQSLDIQSILTLGEHTILTLDVTTDAFGQRVKLDSMAVIQYITNTNGTSFRLDGTYRLYRDDLLISFTDIKKDESKAEDFVQAGDLYPNLTWVDVPPSTGTHTYEIRVNTTNTTNLQSLDITTAHSLNAIVFGPGI
ncbi:MAG: hypothetical protein ACQET6_08250 [Bacillota bacterium]|uniref:hypothetical protein n=1 Tax=Rossellomorea sp. FM04394 TaxID=3243076 RepID=UPI0035A63DFD